MSKKWCGHILNSRTTLFEDEALLGVTGEQGKWNSKHRARQQDLEIQREQGKNLSEGSRRKVTIF